MLGLKLNHINKRGPRCGLVSNGFTDSHIVDYRNTVNIFYKINNGTRNKIHDISRVSCQKGPSRHAYAWQIGPFWQDTLDLLPLQIHHHAYTPDISHTQIMSFLAIVFSVFLPTTKYHLSCFSAHIPSRVRFHQNTRKHLCVIPVQLISAWNISWLHCWDRTDCISEPLMNHQATDDPLRNHEHNATIYLYELHTRVCFR